MGLTTVVSEIAARPATAARYVFGEGLRYDAGSGRLLWVDLTAGRLFSAPLDDPDDARLEVEVDGPLGVAAPLADVAGQAGGAGSDGRGRAGGWLLGAGRGLAVAGPQGGVRHLVDLEPETNRVNDGACDARGRFWLGSMAWDESEGAGSLHRVDLDGSVAPVLRGVSIANGPAWSPDGSVLYLDDSGRGVLLAHDVDEATGALSGSRVLVEYDDGAGDGLTVDDEGHLWVAVFGGSAVHRYDPHGRLVARVALPASQVTSCCLAEGRLFATTAAKGMEHPEPDAGRLFTADVGVGAPPVRPFRGVLPAG